MLLTGGEIVTQCLIEAGVPYAVGIPGHGCLCLVDAFLKCRDQLQVIQVRQEMAAVHLADGYFRVTGQPLAVFASIGPGTVNTAIGLATCYADSTAALVLSGDVHSYMTGKGVLQEIDRSSRRNGAPFLAPFAKGYWRPASAAELPEIMRSAFKTMICGRPGPALVCLGMDIQGEAADVEISAVRPDRPDEKADPETIARAAATLARAERPVIVAGGGVNLAQAWEELRQVAELTGAAVVTTLQGKGCFPEDHPQSAWLAGSKGTDIGNAMTRSADVILAVGCRFADESTSSYRHGITYSIPPTKLIHIDVDPHEIGKNYPVDIGIVGDAKVVLGQLADALSAENIRSREDYIEEIAGRRDEWFLSLGKWRLSDRTPVTISRALKEAREFLSRDAIVVSSSGHSQAQILQEFPFYEPRTNITTGGFSTMGFSLPAAMGAKLAAPERQVAAIMGDGDFLMSVQELATAAQHEIPVVALVMNNAGWMSIADLQREALGSDRVYAVNLSRDGADGPDLRAVSAGFGCYSERVSSPDELKPALDRAFESGRPAVIEVMVNREYPYTGGRAVGWWDVPVPTYLSDIRAQYEKARSEEML